MSAPLSTRALGSLRAWQGAIEDVGPTGVLAYAQHRAQGSLELNAFLHLEEPGGEGAKTSECDGPLAGVPFAVKDNIAVSAQPMTCGAAILRGYTPREDAFVVEKLRAAGARPMGKTNLDAFGMGSTTEHSAWGATLNPWNRHYCPGGSSGGSAVAVAAGVVPFALGSDTGGSVRQPAAHCGIVGFKPTYGAYSRRGLVAFASSLDQVGLLAQGVEDIAFLHSIVGAQDRKDSTSRGADMRLEPRADLGRVSVVYPADLGPLDPSVKAAFHQALGRLRAEGVRCRPAKLPAPETILGTYHVLASAEAASNLARYDGIRYGQRAKGEGVDYSTLIAQSRRGGLGAEVTRRILMGTLILEQGRGGAYYRRALLSRRTIAGALLALLQDAQAILTPTTPAPPFKLGQALADPISAYQGDRFTAPMNLAGLPAISIPMGMSPEGLPLGLQLAGAPRGDGALLALAAAVEGCVSPPIALGGDDAS